MAHTFYSHQYEGAWQQLIDAGVDPIKNGYIFVIGTDVELFNVISPVEIIVDKESEPNSCYFVQRKTIDGGAV